MVQSKKASGRREARRQARREAILDAAMTIVVDEGVEALTMPALARALDVAVGGLYRYFPGKDDLMVALQVQAIVDFGSLLQERLRRFDGRDHGVGEDVLALARLVLGFRTYLDHACTSPASHGLMDAVLSTPRRLLTDAGARAVQEAVRPVLGQCVALVEDAERSEALEPGLADVRTHVLWATLHGLGHFRKRDFLQPEPLRSAQLLEPAFRTVLGGWGARPEALEAALGLVCVPAR